MIWLRRLVPIAAGGLLVAALLKEVAQPRGLRVGEGRIFGIPYSFRLPPNYSVLERYWNAEGNVLAPPLFGIGLLPNVPAIARRLGISR